MNNQLDKGTPMTSWLTRLFLSAALAVVFVPSAMAYSGSYTPGTGINGTVHDLATNHDGLTYAADPSDAPLNRICIYCHAPHNTYRLSTATGGAGPQAPSEYDYLPLWNHMLPGTTPVYTMYENGDGAPQTGSKALQEEATAPGGVSLLCLSCHDGAIAVNSYGNSAQLSASVSNPSNTNTRISNQYLVGKDYYLGNHHPIGFKWSDVEGVDQEIRDADTHFLTPSTTVRDHLYGMDEKMECATCHSVHNKGNGGERLLWRSDQSSQLCLTCHDKGIYVDP